MINDFGKVKVIYFDKTCSLTEAILGIWGAKWVHDVNKELMYNKINQSEMRIFQLFIEMDNGIRLRWISEVEP
jgi:hypothetical protein